MNNLKTDTMCSSQRVRRVLHLRESKKRMTQKRQRETLAGLTGSLNLFDYFEWLSLPQLLRGENDSKQSDEIQASLAGRFTEKR